VAWDALPIFTNGCIPRAICCKLTIRRRTTRHHPTPHRQPTNTA
jgi:hypothetical protein